MARSTKKTPVANSISFAADCFIRFEKWEGLEAGMKHTRLQPKVQDLPRRLQEAFDALDEQVRFMKSEKVRRDNALSALQDAKPETLKQRRYNYKIATTLLEVRRDALRCAWHNLYVFISHSMAEVDSFDRTCFKELFQHNLMCAQSLLDDATDVDGNSLTPASTPRDIHEIHMLVREEYASFVVKRCRKK